MAATANPSGISDWTKLFPIQVTENYAASAVLVKSLTSIAISTIAYLKSLFPDVNFTTDKFANMTIRCLKKDCPDEHAQYLSSAIRQAFVAFDEKFLQRLVLCFYDGSPSAENLLEFYMFSYTYNAESVVLSIKSKSQQREHACSLANVQQQTVVVLRNCVDMLMQVDNPLNNNVLIAVRLYYTDDAPEGYQAPGFSATEEDDHLAGVMSDRVRMGTVQTPYHKFVGSYYVKEADGTVCGSADANATLTPPEITETQFEIADKNGMAPTIKCECGATNDNAEPAEDLLELITCQYCRTHQHAVCYGLLPSHAARVSQHCCAACSDLDPARPGRDVPLTSTAQSRRKSLCFYRRVLVHCSKVKCISVLSLVLHFQKSPEVVSKIVSRLAKKGVVESESNDNDTPLEINQLELHRCIARYFKPNSIENELTNQLLEQTLNSQEMLPDPLEDALSPAERETLQSTNQLGNVLERQPTVVLSRIDSTIEQYKDAIMPCAGQSLDQPPKRCVKTTTKRKNGTGAVTFTKNFNFSKKRKY